MDLISEIITGVLLSGTVLYTGITSCAKIRKFNTTSTFMVLFYICLSSLIVLEVLCIMDNIHFLKFQAFIAIIISTLNAIVLSLFIMLSIDEISPKKIKTIWRIPMIGFLLGFLNLDYQFYVNLGLWSVIFLILIKNSKKLRILTGKMVALFIWVVSLYFVRENSFWYLNSVFIFFSLITFGLWDMIGVKTLVWDKNE